MKKPILFSILLFAILALFAEGAIPTTQNTEGITLLQSSLAPSSLQKPFESSNIIVATNSFPIAKKTVPGVIVGQNSNANNKSVQYRGNNDGYYSLPVILLVVLLIVLIAR